MDGWNTTFRLGRPIFKGELLVSGRVKWLENGVGVYQCHFQVPYIIIYIPIWESYYSHQMTFFTRYTWCPNTNSSVCCQALVENNRRLLTNSFRLWTINALGTQINQQQMIVLGDFGGNVGRSSHTRWVFVGLFSEASCPFLCIWKVDGVVLMHKSLSTPKETRLGLLRDHKDFFCAEKCPIVFYH